MPFDGKEKDADGRCCNCFSSTTSISIEDRVFDRQLDINFENYVWQSMLCKRYVGDLYMLAISLLAFTKIYSMASFSASVLTTLFHAIRVIVVDNNETVTRTNHRGSPRSDTNTSTSHGAKHSMRRRRRDATIPKTTQRRSLILVYREVLNDKDRILRI